MALGCETFAVNGQRNGQQLNQEKNYSNGKSSHLWEYPWNTNEIRKSSGNWTLAGDVGLLNFLQEFSHQIISRTHEIEKAVDDLVHKTKGASAKVNNVVNDFQMLSNLQFVENRVYDEEVEDLKEEELRGQEIQKSKKQREAEMMPRISTALELGLRVIDEAFDKINVEELSDSEEEEDRSSEGRIILEPKDPYENRPLPHIIGSELFHEDDHAGLHDTQFEEFIEVSAEDDSVSLSAESEDDNEQLAVKPTVYHENQLAQTKDLNDVHSDSESSDLFENEEEKKTEYASATDSSEEAEVKKKQDKNSHVSVIGEIKSLGIFNSGSDIPETVSAGRKQSSLEVEDDLFATNQENALDDEDDSPFHKKSGLFSTDNTIFGSANEEKFLDEDLFEEREKAPVNEKTRNVTDNFVKNVEALSLFDDDENEEIFSAPSTNIHSGASELSKKNENHVKANGQKTFSPSTVSANKNTASDSFAKLKVPVKTAAGTSLFDDDSDVDTLFSSAQDSNTLNAVDDDDLFSTATYNASSRDLKENEMKTKMPKSPKTGTGLQFSLFEDDENPKPEHKKRPELSLFEDSDDLFSPVTDLAPEIPKTQKLPTLEESKPVPLRFADKVDTSNTLSTINKKSPTMEPSKSISRKFDKSDKYGNSDIGIISKKLPNMEESESISLSFDEPVDTSNTLSAISKDRVKIPGKRRKPTRKGRHAALQNTDALDNVDVPRKEAKPLSTQTKLNHKDLSFKDVIDELLFPAVNTSQINSKETLSSKQNQMDSSLFESDLLNSLHNSNSNISETVKDTSNLFHISDTSKKTLSSSISVSSIKTNSSESSKGSTNSHPEELKQKYDLSNVLDTSSIEDDDLFAEPAFKGFKKSLESRHSIFKMDEDDDDDDIFKVASDDHTKSKFTITKDSDDIFGDSTSDIFAELQNEKYEMFPSQSPPEDEIDDIFGIPKKGAEK